MKTWKRILGVTLSAILLLSAVPAALADDAAETTPTVERLELENYVKALSTTELAAPADEQQASGGKFLNNCRLNDVICLGEVDLTGLRQITLSIATNTITSGFAFSIDGLDTIIATVTTGATGGWTTFKEFTAAVSSSVSAAYLAGTHTLYMTVVASSNNMHGGNADYVELTKVAPETVGEKTVEKQFGGDIDLGLSSSSITKANNIDNQLVVDDVRVIGSLQTNYVLGYADIALDGLQALEFDYAPSAGLKVEVYAGDTMDSAVLIAAPTLNTALNAGAASWYGADNYRSTGVIPLTFGADAPATTNLFFKLTADRGNFRTFTLHYTANAILVKTDKSVGFSDAIDLDLSVNVTSGCKQDANGEPIIGGLTAGSSILAYPNISLDNLTGLQLNYAPQNSGNLSVRVSYGDSAATAMEITTLSLDQALTLEVQEDTTVADAQKWWNYKNYRDSVYVPLSLDENASGTTTLFFSLLGTARCNFKTFTLYYEEDISGAWQYEMENYVWGASSDNGSNWIRNGAPTMVESPYPNDIFYLGKADLTNLESVVVAAAQGRGSNPPSYVFYADCDVAFDRLIEDTADADGFKDHDRYEYTGDAAVTGGVELGRVTVSCTNAWVPTHHYSFTISPETLAELGDGPHDIYMQVLSNGAPYGGNIDYIRFNGLQKTDFDFTSNFPQDELTVTFVDEFDEEVYSATVHSVEELASLLTTVKAPSLGGYTFCGWSEGDAAAVFDTYKNQLEPYNIQAIYSVGDNEGQRLQYTVTVGADITSSNCTISNASTIDNIYFDNRVELALADGVSGTVAYWELDGQKMAYGQSTFTFYVTGNNSVRVVLNDGSDVIPEASVQIQQYATQYNAYNNTYVLSVIAQTYVPEGHVSEFGVYYTASLDELKNIQNGDANARFVKVISSKSGNNQQYMTHLLAVSPNRTRYAMAYAIIDGTTVYSLKGLQFMTPADGSAATAELVAISS